MLNENVPIIFAKKINGLGMLLTLVLKEAFIAAKSINPGRYYLRKRISL